MFVLCRFVFLLLTNARNVYNGATHHIRLVPSPRGYAMTTVYVLTIRRNSDDAIVRVIETANKDAAFDMWAMTLNNKNHWTEVTTYTC